MLHVFDRFHPLARLEKQRAKFASQDDLPPCIAQLVAQPYPGPKTPLNELEFLVFDFETTGLSPEKGRILSIGYLEINNMLLDISTAFHSYISAEKYVNPESAVINHIVPEMLRHGEPFDQAMEALFTTMAGKILIAHGTMIEKRFIDAYVKRRYQLDSLPLLWLDTLAIEKSLFRNKHETVGDYQLSSVRERYGLPPYLAHNALSDSIATGELFLALVKQVYGNKPPRLDGLFKPL